MYGLESTSYYPQINRLTSSKPGDALFFQGDWMGAAPAAVGPVVEIAQEELR